MKKWTMMRDLIHGEEREAAKRRWEWENQYLKSTENESNIGDWTTWDWERSKVIERWLGLERFRDFGEEEQEASECIYGGISNGRLHPFSYLQTLQALSSRLAGFNLLKNKNAGFKYFKNGLLLLGPYILLTLTT